MRFFLSGEVDVLVADAWRRLASRIEERLNEELGDRSYGGAIEEIALIPMILRPAWREGHRERRLWKRSAGFADLRRKVGTKFRGDALIADIVATLGLTRDDLRS